jgi:hypothetical protein
VSSSPARISPASPEAPSRIIVRASSDFVLRGVPESVRCFGGIRRATILCAIVAANVQHVTRSAELAWRYARLCEILPDCERRPVNMNSLAASLTIPWETARRHIHALIDDGLCVKIDGGVIVPVAVLTSPRVMPFNAALKDSFWRMIKALRAIGFDFAEVAARTDFESFLIVAPGVHPPGQSPERLVSRVVMEFYLQTIVGASRPFGGDWIPTTIFGAIMAINGEPISRDPESAWLYAHADSPPPDQVRRPASIRETAARLGLPQETVRRQVLSLMSQDRVERTPKGYLASMGYMQSPAARDSAVEMTRAFYRMVHDLAVLGVQL